MQMENSLCFPVAALTVSLNAVDFPLLLYDMYSVIRLFPRDYRRAHEGAVTLIWLFLKINIGSYFPSH